MAKETKSELIARLKAEIGKNGENMPTIAESLEFRRDQYGLSQKDFAHLLGMQPAHYSEVIHRNYPLPFSAAKAAYAIGVHADVLLQK